jgi:hypothetical protein
MDKTFQVSYGYVTGVAVFLALSKSDLIGEVSSSLGIRISDLVALTVLLINVVYLILACAFLFAILKRGLFILLMGYRTSDSIYPAWEAFVRGLGTVKTSRPFRAISWNIDNYYMLPIYVFIVAGSVLAFLYALGSPRIAVRVISIILALFHILPAIMLWYIRRMTDECKEALIVAGLVPATHSRDTLSPAERQDRP